MTQGTSTMMATATASSTSTNEAQASSNQALAPKGLAQHKTPILESRTPLMMQLIVHRALLTDPGSTWTTGPMMAQAAHAATAVTVKTLSTSALTQEYFSEKNLTYMRKVVLQTPSKGALADLAALSAKLTEGRREWMQRRQSQDDTSGDDEFPDHHLWIEQPESVPTCLAIAPNRKPAVSSAGLV